MSSPVVRLLSGSMTYLRHEPNFLPLLNICGTSSVKKSFVVDIVLLNHEKGEHYAWTIHTLYQLLRKNGIPLPGVVITDHEKASMKSLVWHHAFPIMVHILIEAQ